MAVNIGGPHRGHAAGNTDVEKQASQLASDVKLKVKEKLGPHTDMNPAQVAQAYETQLDSSPAPSTVKAIARKKLKIGVSEQYGIPELARKSTVNALLKVFAEGPEEKEQWIVVTDKKTGNRYRRRADRAKIAELRANPNIRNVEITGYHPKENDDEQGKKTARVKAGKGLHPGAGEAYEKKYKGGNNTVGDLDHDGTVEPDGHEYAGVKDNAIKAAMAKRKKKIGEEFLGEVKKEKNKGRDDKITGERVNNSKYINLKPTMEQSMSVGNSNQSQTYPAPTQQTQGPAAAAALKQKIAAQKRELQARKTELAAQQGGLARNIPLPTSEEVENVQEVAPPGMEKTVRGMKKYPELSRGKTKKGKKKNIYALAWYMYNKKKGVKEESENVDEARAVGSARAGDQNPKGAAVRVSSGRGMTMTPARGLGASKPAGDGAARAARQAAQAKADRIAAARDRAASDEDRVGRLIRSVQKSHYEPQGEMIGEEESDRLRDRKQEVGGMSANADQRPPRPSTGPSQPYDPKEQAKKNKAAMDAVRQAIIAKHGQGSLM